MSPQAGWILVTQVIPRLASAIPNNCCCVGAEDHQELIQDAAVMAARMLTFAEAKGKKVTPGNIAYYTILHAKSGRRAVGFSSVDVHGTATQLQGKSKLESFEEPVAYDECSQEPLVLHEVFADEAEDPSMQAARKMDWENFMAHQNERGQAILQALDEGRSLKDVARQFNVCPSAIKQHKDKLASALLEYMGADILKESVRRPAWMDAIMATRESQAVRAERRH